MAIRDSKTGRFAKAWKAKRFPDRFFDYSEGPLNVKEAFKKYAQESDLWDNFDLTKSRLTVAREGKDWILEFKTGAKKPSRGMRKVGGTPDTMSFTFDRKTRRFKKDTATTGGKKSKGWGRKYEKAKGR